MPLVHEPWNAPPKRHLVGHFRNGQVGMAVACPDLCEEDPDGDRIDNAWPDGLAIRVDRSVCTFHPNLDLLDQGLAGLIAEAAVLSGLHVLVPQNGLLHRHNLGVVTLSRAAQRRPKTAASAATTANPIRSGDVDAVMDPPRLGLSQRLAAFGFEAKAPGPRGVERSGATATSGRSWKRADFTATPNRRCIGSIARNPRE